MWKLHRKLSFPNIFRLDAIYTWAPAFKGEMVFVKIVVNVIWVPVLYFHLPLEKDVILNLSTQTRKLTIVLYQVWIK